MCASIADDPNEHERYCLFLYYTPISNLIKGFLFPSLYLSFELIFVQCLTSFTDFATLTNIAPSFYIPFTRKSVSLEDYWRSGSSKSLEN